MPFVFFSWIGYFSSSNWLVLSSLSHGGTSTGCLMRWWSRGMFSNKFLQQSKNLEFIYKSIKLFLASISTYISFIFYSCSLGLFTSTIFYIASFYGIGLMYSLYVPKVRCVLNIFFISWTLILLIVMMVVSLHSKVCSSKLPFFRSSYKSYLYSARI